MSVDLDVFVATRRLSNDRMELVLEAMEEDGVRWSKVYDGFLFLSMDAQSLGLLEPILDAPSNGPKLQLKRSGRVQRDLLLRMRFVEAHGRGSQAQ